MADSLKQMGDMLPADQWQVRLTKAGKAEVCVSQLDGYRYWYTVNDVQREGEDYAAVAFTIGAGGPKSLRPTKRKPAANPKKHNS